MNMIEEDVLQPLYVKMLVVDEADELLNRGFKDMIQEIKPHLYPDVQIVISAPTLPLDLQDFMSKFVQYHTLVQ